MNIHNFYPTTPYFFLSNFYEVPFVWHGYTWRSAENAYQASKVAPTERNSEWETFLTCTPKESKKLGKQVVLRKDWEHIKVVMMESILNAKFYQNEDIKQKLIDTGNAELIEGNSWHDTFWGVCNGTGKNMLGQILMKLRGRLQLEEVFS